VGVGGWVLVRRVRAWGEVGRGFRACVCVYSVYACNVRVRVRVHVCVRAPYGVCACGGGTLRAGMLMRE